MWQRVCFDTDLYHFISWFFVYSILGWIVESIYMSFCNRKLTNRGFIHGPVCPIYGVGALTVYYILKPFQRKYLSLYILGCIVPTFLEYCTAKLTSQMFGIVWWDYRNKPFNYKGIICLESTIVWGFYTLFLFLFLQKTVERIVSFFPEREGEKFLTMLLIYFVIDLSICLRKAWKGETETTENNSLAM